MHPILALVLATLASSLRVPQTRVETPTRRAALTALAAAASLPILHADAAPSFDKGALDLKPREERKKLKPDGFGGYIERDALVESIPGRMLNARDDETAAAPKVAAAPRKAPPPSKSSEPPLSLEEMVNNSIRSKEELYGRKLTETEKTELAAKVKSLLGK